MSDEPLPAARKTDFVAHDNSQALKLGGFILFEAVAYGAGSLIKAPLVFAGPAGWAALVVIAVIEWKVGNFIQDTLDEKAKDWADPGIPKISTGSDNVFVNSLEAVRGAKRDKVECHNQKVEQGSQWVTINKAPASRWRDRTSCKGGAFLTKNPALIPENVLIGGPPTDYENVYEVQKFLELVWFIAEPLHEGHKSGIGEALDAFLDQSIGKSLDWFTK